MSYYKTIDFSELVGKKIVDIKVDYDNDEITFITTEGTYSLFHEWDCSEEVVIDDINGDLNDLIGETIITAEELTNTDDDPGDRYVDCSYTWTFYTIRTQKHCVDIRWFGTSNGYYSESVDLHVLVSDDE